MARNRGMGGAGKEMKILYQNTVYDVSTDEAKKLFEIVNEYLLVADGTTVYTYRHENKLYVRVGEEYFEFDIPKDEDEDSFFEDSQSANEDNLVPPMPGSVVKLHVKEGDEVEEGTALITVEAMKMETTLYASVAGTVTEVNVSEGHQVNTDTVMIRVVKSMKNEE